MSFVAKKLRQDRFKLVTDAQSLINADNATSETMETFDAMMAEADKLMEQITRVEKAADEAAKIDQIIGVSAERSGVSSAEKLSDVETYKKAFVAQMRNAAKIPLSASDKSALENYQNAASTSGTAGGYTVQTDLMKQIYSALILEGGVRSVARILQTSQGNNLDIPQNDDTAQVATLVAENTTLGSGTDLAFTKVTLAAYKYTSGVQLISTELLQDSAFDFEQFLQGQLVHRFARGTNLAYSTGTGSSQPQGVVTAASSGRAGAAGQVTSIIYADILALEHSVAVPYRRNARWMMSDAMFKTIKGLVDSQGRPLWLPNLQVGAPDSLMGYPITLNADMAVPAASAKSLLFGDFSQFIIRDVLDMNFSILNELYAATGQVGVVGLMRTDSRSASTGAYLRYYSHPAS